MNNKLKNDLLNLDILLEALKFQGLEFLKNIGERASICNAKTAIGKRKMII